MTPAHIFFVVIYLIIFVIYASSFSSIMQDLNADIKRLKVKGMNVTKIQKRVKINQKKAAEMKRSIWPPVLILMFIYLVCVIVAPASTSTDYLIFLAVSAFFCSFLLITNWMKGAGTIDDQNRMGKSLWN